MTLLIEEPDNKGRSAFRSYFTYYYSANKVEATLLCLVILLILVESIYFYFSQYLEGLGVVSFGLWWLLYMFSFGIAFVVFVLWFLFTVYKWKSGRRAFRIAMTIMLPILIVGSFFVMVFTGGYRSFSEGYLERLDKRGNAEEIRQWSHLHYTETDAYRYLPEEEVPDFLKRLEPSFWHNTRASTITSDQGSYVSVYWGGALIGHWGLAIGSEDMQLENTETDHYHLWEPGIYFWRGK